MTDRAPKTLTQADIGRINAELTKQGALLGTALASLARIRGLLQDVCSHPFDFVTWDQRRAHGPDPGRLPLLQQGSVVPRLRRRGAKKCRVRLDR